MLLHKAAYVLCLVCVLNRINLELLDAATLNRYFFINKYMKPQVNKIILCWNYVGKEWTVFSSEVSGKHLQHIPNLQLHRCTRKSWNMLQLC
jgi:hypothetical protein